MNNYHIVDVQFSGKPAVYSYTIHPEDQVQEGWRVVVPTSIKDDGTLSLSIATVIRRYEINSLEDSRLKPTVQTIYPVMLDYAKSELLRIAALGAVE